MTLAVSLVAFDGLATETALDTIAAAGASHVEPAYIAGSMAFTEDDLSEAAATTLRAQIVAAGLGCVAVSAHMDNGAADATAKLERRLRFAQALGARFVITNTAREDRRDAFLRTARAALRTAEACGVMIAFENPGHGDTDLLRRGTLAADLLRDLGSPWATLNYDVGNALTNSEGAVRPEQDLPSALPLARHLHLKDMTAADGAWVYTAIGQGALDYRAILAQVATRPNVPVCVELPLRQIRKQGAAPVRGEVPTLDFVRAAVTQSVRYVRGALPLA